MKNFLTSCTRVASALFLCLAQTACNADEKAQYEPTWESLDQRQTPQWWSDAKFGIFIHWGLYAVPSYSPKGTYSEWYWERINANGKGPEGDDVIDMKDSDKVHDFHVENYGKDVSYESFLPQFRAELFNPDEWANIFQRSGAKYVVLTSKHHEGFTLWPSAEADKTWGKPWNALSAGPKRDLAGDLTQSVRDAGLKMGFYYSVSEWYNPLYRKDIDAYVDQHMLPQMKDLVTRYNPSVIFSDGEWGYDSDTWRSREFLSWLYNREGSDDVVVNDRWGKETRHNHGGYYTTEYGAGLPDASHPWEESRGMGTSYGYNRIESVDDYNSTQELVLTLIDTVSRGGNFLLNIGPTADGRIPVIMQERLVGIGRWLDVNGEAIYGTQTWENPVQWGEGVPPEFKVEAHGFVKYDILQQTMNPPQGQAAKELFFTRKGDALYAISPKFPKGKLTVKGVSPKAGAKVNMLGHSEPLEWKQVGDDLVITPPVVVPGELGFNEAFVFKIQ